MTSRSASSTSSIETGLRKSRLSKWIRRSVSVPTVFIALAVLLLSTPIWVPIAFCADLATGFRTSVLRCGMFLLLYLACEFAGIVASFALYVVGGARVNTPEARERSFDRHFALQRWWAGMLLHGAVRLFRLKIHVEGEEVVDRPMILMLRHASIADTLLASEYISKSHGIHLRYILKRELLVDPCLDIVGHRLPNRFVVRDSDDTDRELAGIADLLSDLRSREGVLIYPEGTRYTPEKRDRVLARLSAGGHTQLAARAAKLRHTLPPRLGGSLALLQANPGLDVVFCAHTGFESARRPLDLLSGSMLDREIAVRFWRVPQDEIPDQRVDRIDWLFEQWQKVDQYIERVQSDCATG